MISVSWVELLINVLMVRDNHAALSSGYIKSLIEREEVRATRVACRASNCHVYDQLYQCLDLGIVEL